MWRYIIYVFAISALIALLAIGVMYLIEWLFRKTDKTNTTDKKTNNNKTKTKRKKTA
jgi:heme/copper-type cytochrome/quinol oxidase subunit 2